MGGSISSLTLLLTAIFINTYIYIYKIHRQFLMHENHIHSYQGTNQHLFFVKKSTWGKDQKEVLPLSGSCPLELLDVLILSCFLSGLFYLLTEVTYCTSQLPFSLAGAAGPRGCPEQKGGSLVGSLKMHTLSKTSEEQADHYFPAPCVTQSPFTQTREERWIEQKKKI